MAGLLPIQFLIAWIIRCGMSTQLMVVLKRFDFSSFFFNNLKLLKSSKLWSSQFHISLHMKTFSCNCCLVCGFLSVEFIRSVIIGASVSYNFPLFFVKRFTFILRWLFYSTQVTCVLWLVGLVVCILNYYMALSHEDWELQNSQIWLAKIDIDRGLDFPI